MQCIGGKKRLGCILDFLVEVFDSNICFLYLQKSSFTHRTCFTKSFIQRSVLILFDNIYFLYLEMKVVILNLLSLSVKLFI